MLRHNILDKTTYTMYIQPILMLNTNENSMKLYAVNIGVFVYRMAGGISGQTGYKFLVWDGLAIGVSIHHR